ncbi:purine NTP phosphatase [Desulfocarbo indianensis]|nr:purine NTP phosphatase [Desulfocarbo indianensis]
MDLVLASNNQGKLREIRQIMEPLGLEVLSAAQAGFSQEVEETGQTFEANAKLKACIVAQVLGLPALADDSGLVVEALGGAPGVYSARYAGPGASDAERSGKLLKKLDGVPPEKRGAAFVCVMACCLPSGLMLTAEGRLEGRIALQPAGDNGFGYDPVFELPERGCTVAQLSAAEKNAISHRGRALRRLAEHLKDFLKQA